MAKLFIVGQGPIEPEETQPETDESDIETAFRALAFLMEFLDQVGPDELRRCAEEIQAHRVKR